MRRAKVEWRQGKNKGVNFSFSLRDDAVATAELNEFVRYYEPLVLRAHSSWETQDKLASTFHFKAHGRLAL